MRAQSMTQRQWLLKAPAPSEELGRYSGFSPILAQILINRGLDDPSAARHFIEQQDLRDDPFAMRDMPKAVTRINQAIADGQRVAVYGDFDADGLCSTALMTQTLEALGCDVLPYIPDRASEGYGLNTGALQRLAEAGIGLVITVDCGIRSLAEVQAAMRDGLDIIVSDHHSVGAELPPALAVINPQRDDCPGEATMAGVGVAFMLARALLTSRWDKQRDSYPRDLRLSDLLDLVALGTVADVMPLNASLNRRLVRQGLLTLNEGRRPGLNALAQVAGLRRGAITARDLGFALGPRINAAGRLDSADTALRLLCATADDEAMELARELQDLNTQRQKLTRQAQQTISERLDDADAEWLLFAGADDILPGIVGLVAGKLTEQYYRPAVVLEYGESNSRASCRSIPEFDITRALDECADLLMRHGGHAMAAGLTVANGNIDSLRQALTSKARDSLSGKTLMPRLPIDCEMALSDLDMRLLAELEQLEPTGHGNPPATFLTRDLELRHRRRVGADGQHLKLRLGAEGCAPLEAIGFGMGERAKSLPARVDAVYQAELNEWQGRRRLQMRLLDIQPAGQQL